jgi:hypothetical protein
MQAFNPGPDWLSVPIRVILPAVTCTFNRHRPPQSNEHVVVIIFSLFFAPLVIIMFLKKEWWYKWFISENF